MEPVSPPAKLASVRRRVRHAVAALTSQATAPETKQLNAVPTLRRRQALRPRAANPLARLGFVRRLVRHVVVGIIFLGIVPGMRVLNAVLMLRRRLRVRFRVGRLEYVRILV